MAVARSSPNDLRYRSLNGAAKRSVKRSAITHAFRLLWFWFKQESPVLTVLNASISMGILALIILMTPIGGEQLRWPQSTTLEAYVGAGVLAVALLKAMRAWIGRRSSLMRRVFGVVNAVAFALAGSWLLAVWFYASPVVPWPFKSWTSLAGASMPADLNFFDASIVPLLAPALAVLFGLVLSAKQLKSLRRATRERRRNTLALSGFLASACTLSIGAYAGEYRYFGDRWEEPSTAGLSEQASARGSYQPLFAANVTCHVSDSFGLRRNPFDHRVNEFHPGVDIAVREGTPIHAMASGTVIFSGIDRGFGNMVAIRANDGSTRPSTLVTAHMQRIFVAPGSLVRSGDLIGIAGSTGRSTGPHVHLQVCLNARTNRSGGFVCGAAQNPYESWRTLSAIARSSCAHGPIV